MKNTTTKQDVNTISRLDYFNQFNLVEPFLAFIGFTLFACLFIACFFSLNYYHQVLVFHGFTWFGATNEGLGLLDEGGDHCDIYDGKWVWDDNYPLYESPDCPFIDSGFRCLENGRSDSFYTKWRWQPRACNLPRFNATKMLEKLRNRRIAFIGDSIGRNQWESLLCMLSSAIPNKDSIYEVNGNPITKHKGFLVFRFAHYNCTVEYYRAPFLVAQGSAPSGAPKGVKMALRLDRMDRTQQQWVGADVMVFNTGHWWSNDKTTNRGGTWSNGGHCHHIKLPDFGPFPDKTEEHVDIVRDVLLKHPGREQVIETMNVTPMTYQRQDGHTSLYHFGRGGNETEPPGEDCSHWCLPGVPDLWNELLYALFLKWESDHSSTPT